MVWTTEMHSRTEVKNKVQSPFLELAGKCTERGIKRGAKGGFWKVGRTRDATLQMMTHLY
jgi:hypothetical protein